MDKRTLYDGFDHFEEEVSALLAQTKEMKQSVQMLIEKNAALQVENENLRTHLAELIQQGLETDETKQALSESRMNLEKLYEEGFHVCNFLYGSRRDNDDECAFCLDVIYGERNK